MKSKDVVEEKIMEMEEAAQTEENGQVLADEEPKVFGKPKTGHVINSKYVRVRKTPSGSAQVATVAEYGDAAEILEKIPGFYKVRTCKNGVVGFIPSDYFQED